MNHMLFVSVFFISLLNPAIAQTRFGVKGGANIAFFNEDQSQFGENPESEAGYVGGVFVDFKMNESFHIQPELLYAGVGD